MHQEDAEFLQRKTLLWFYILAEAASLEGENAWGRWAPRSYRRCWSDSSGVAQTPSCFQGTQVLGIPRCRAHRRERSPSQICCSWPELIRVTRELPHVLRNHDKCHKPVLLQIHREFIVMF
jgi:hypothetical protein